jgi:hypothetical protein
MKTETGVRACGVYLLLYATAGVWAGVTALLHGGTTAGAATVMVVTLALGIVAGVVGMGLLLLAPWAQLSGVALFVVLIAANIVGSVVPQDAAPTLQVGSWCWRQSPFEL